MKNDKNEICRRIKLLVDLCENTEPEEPSERFLFSNHLIDSKELLQDAENDELNDHNDWVDIMRRANKLWRVRKKIEKVGWDFFDDLEMHETIEDLLSNNHKIAAIQYYRQIMQTHFDTKASLKESKDFVDNIQEDMIGRGILVK